MSESPADRMRQARERAGFRSASAFAEKHGLPVSTYRSAENGTRGLRIAAAKQYAPLLGVTWQWLMDGGPLPAAPPPPRPLEPAPTTELDIRNLPMDVPVRGTAACGDDGLFEMNGQVLAHVRRPPRLMGVKGVYALYVHGNSMSPWREHGGLVYVHPHQPPRVNDYVVVQLHTDREEDEHTSPDHNFPAYIKRLVKQTATQLVLHQFRPERDFSIPLKKVKSIHRIPDWDELMGF